LTFEARTPHGLGANVFDLRRPNEAYREGSILGRISSPDVGGHLLAVGHLARVAEVGKRRRRGLEDQQCLLVAAEGAQRGGACDIDDGLVVGEGRSIAEDFVRAIARGQRERRVTAAGVRERELCPSLSQRGDPDEEGTGRVETGGNRERVFG
jgi:hypothetical protein